MKEELISKELSLKYLPGSLNPIDINEHYLQEVGIVDEANQLNRGMLRIGSLGTNIIFSNKTKDEIRVQPTQLLIESKSEERLIFIINKLKESFGSVSIQSGEYGFDIHLIDDNYPQEIFEKYTSTKDLTLNVIQFGYNNANIGMYSCGRNKIHIRAIIQNTIGKPLSDFNLKEDLETEQLNDIYSKFKTQDLKL